MIEAAFLSVSITDSTLIALKIDFSLFHSKLILSVSFDISCFKQFQKPDVLFLILILLFYLFFHAINSLFLHYIALQSAALLNPISTLIDELMN